MLGKGGWRGAEFLFLAGSPISSFSTLLPHPFSWDLLMGSWHPKGPNSKFWHCFLIWNSSTWPFMYSRYSKGTPGGMKICHAQGLQGSLLKTLKSSRVSFSLAIPELDFQVACVGGTFWGRTGCAFTSWELESFPTVAFIKAHIAWLLQVPTFLWVFPVSDVER